MATVAVHGQYAVTTCYNGKLRKELGGSKSIAWEAILHYIQEYVMSYQLLMIGKTLH